jgi:RNA polymerase sigma-70 factor (ECF subfamily)
MDAALNWSPMTRTSNGSSIEALDPDAQLMLRFRDGDVEAFESLFSRHMRAIVNYACRFVHNRETAEELAQEIFIKVYEGAGRYRPKAKFTTWLYTIATNVCLNEVRKPHFRAARRSVPVNSRHNAAPAPWPGGSKFGPDESLDRQAIAQALKQALDGIPDKQRTAFILNKYQEFSYAEVSEIMHVSEKAVKSLIHRARETLAGKLQPLLPELLRE